MTQQTSNSAPAAAPGPMVAPPAVAPHLMGFGMAPAAPLFPPLNMLNNPDAMIGMPGMFHQGAPAGQHGVIGNPGTNGFNAAQPSHHVQQQVQQQQQQYLQQVVPSMHQPLAPNNGAGQQIMMNQGYAFQVPVPATLGGASMPALPRSHAALQVQAAAAAAAAVPLQNTMQIAKPVKKEAKKADLTPQEKARQNRDRNREHARSTRLRKKAYVQKLKELVEGLHAERTEEVRKRRVAIQHLSEVQGVRRAVVRSFLRFHSNYESDERKWSTILEDTFWLKQPVTPYRSFQRSEVEQECRISRGIGAMVADTASVSVMVEGIGSRSSRWMQLKREEVLNREGIISRPSRLPNSIDGDSSQKNGVSSLSSSSGEGSSNGSGGEEERQRALAAPQTKHPAEGANGNGVDMQVTSSSESSNESTIQQRSNEFHDYHAAALPDPMLGDSEGSSPSDSPEESNGGADGGMGSKDMSTDSSSGDEEKLSERAPESFPAKRRKIEDNQAIQMASNPTFAVPIPTGVMQRSVLPPNIAKKGGISHNIRPAAGPPPGRNGNGRMNLASVTPLQPFMGIGKKPVLPPAMACGQIAVGAAMVQQPQVPPAVVPSSSPQSRQQIAHAAGPTTVSSSSTNNGTAAVASADLAPTSIGGPNVIAPDAADTSSSSSNSTPEISAFYHVNEDDMLLTEDNLMCPFVFRSQDAVQCGALSECVMPGMLRCNFSPRNKLLSVEMVYDTMGFMQQLERACGTESLAQVVPGSLEMALAPNCHEARVITLAKFPFLIVSVNEAWTRTTKFTQMEVEGRDLSVLNGARTNPDTATRPGKPIHKFDEVAKGVCACSTSIHYDKEGREFVDFVCSYPLTK